MKRLTHQLAWLPLVFLGVAVVLLAMAPASEPHESAAWVVVSNLMVVLPISLIIAILAARTYLKRGETSLLWLGCAALIWGLSGVAGGSLIGSDPNAGITVHNILICLSAASHLSGVLFSSGPQTGPPGSPYRLSVSYLAALLAPPLVLFLNGSGALPTFFIPGVGGTPIRQLLLLFTLLMFVIAATVLLVRSWKAPGSFPYWYGLAMLLISVGVMALLVQSSSGSTINWVGRSAQILGTAYMLAATLAARRSAQARGMSVDIALREAEQLFDHLIDMAPDGIVVHELLAEARPGLFVHANPAACSLLGYSAQEMSRLSLLEIVSAADQDKVQEDKTPVGGDSFMLQERTLLARDGRLIPAQIATRQFHRDGRELVISIIHDVSERKKSEAVLQAMQAELEEITKFHIARQTVAALAHELNQPLNAVAAYAEAALRLLRSGNLQPEKLQHAIESSTQQAQRAGHVVRELLAFLNRSEVETEPIHLNPVIKGVLRRVEADGFSHIRFSLHLDPELATVSANRLQVEKVVMNLIKNGAEAMRDAGIGDRSIVIRVRTANGSGMAQVTVTDSGPGVDSQTLDSIFKPFFTTKPKGLGMGLAISRAIIEAHGGELWVDSEPGQGASFHFTLPFAQ